MEMLAFWLNHHRIWITLLIGLGMWAGAYFWYFGTLVRRALNQSGPRRWEVDLVNKRASRGGRAEKI